MLASQLSLSIDNLSFTLGDVCVAKMKSKIIEKHSNSNQFIDQTGIDFSRQILNENKNSTGTIKLLSGVLKPRCLRNIWFCHG